MNLKVYIDGTVRPNGAGVGVYIPGHVRYSAKVQVSRGDIAEYTALLHALKIIYNISDSQTLDKITIFSDSKCLIEHVQGVISPDNGELKALKEKIDGLLDKVKFQDVKINMSHFPKRMNTLPHSLAKKGAKL